ncbi:hypothetical protein MMC30_002476 [Trapelia coarctata]|nr:hypothetical protein [Trapelia coarctata]
MGSPNREPIAIVGSACRFPGGCTSPNRLWELLRGPRDLLSEIPSTRFNTKAFYHPDGGHHGATNVDKSYLLSEDHCLFDATFFNISPREADAMDPQQRLLLETVYEGIESAGYSIDGMQGSDTAVFVGVMTGDYYDIQMRDLDSIPQYLATGVARSIISNRISYFFDWKGPSMTIDTACSSSLVALHQAVQSLRSGESAAAIVAGANLILGPEAYIYESKLHMLSPTGRSRMWDANADGYARGEGFAAVMLKPLSKALKDGDHVESIIRETGVNQDGRTQGITMPSHTSQAALIRQTYAKAGLDLRNPRDRCQYFEAHGTGTLAGDPIEAEAVTKAFFAAGEQATPEQILHVGSIKTVIGHLEGTAGLAGLLKVSLAMQNGIIPPNLWFNDLNPAIKPFYNNLKIPTSAIPWPPLSPGAPRRASVNSFGFGGTNAHAIVESYGASRYMSVCNMPVAPAESTRVDAICSAVSLPLPLSANSEKSLLKMMKSFSAYLQSNKDVSLRDINWTMHQRRTIFPYRICFSGLDHDQLQSQIDAKLAECASAKEGTIGTRANSSQASSRRILGIFTGQGAQWATMGSHLIKTCLLFAQSIEKLDQSLAKLPDGPSWTLMEELQASDENSRIGEAAISQPACTALQVALIDLAHQAGIQFSAVVGHSSGEIAAAYAAGIISSADAIRIAYYRGLYAKLACDSEGKAGGMMATGYTYNQATAFCEQDQYEGRLSVAACNGPKSVTLAGDLEAIEEAKEHLDGEGTFARVLKVDTAYHSRHMQPCAEPYLKSMRKCKLVPKAARKDCVFISTVYESTDLDEQIIQSMKDIYWKDNMTNPVLFYQGIKQCFERYGEFDLAFEIGPHAALKGPTAQTVKEACDINIPYHGALNRGENDIQAFSAAIGFIWTQLGSSALDIPSLMQAYAHIEAKPKLVKGLPSYPWHHVTRYWKESRISEKFRLRKDSIHELLGTRSADDNDEELRWRNILRLQEMSWASGHSFQHQALFPAAGYISMALEAARSLGDGAAVELIELSDLNIYKAITLDEDSPGVETLFTMSREHSDQEDSESLVYGRFVLYACVKDDVNAMNKHFSGKVMIKLGEPSMETLPQRSEFKFPMSAVDVDRFYESLSAIGLDYTDMFRGITSIDRRMDMARANISRSISTTPDSKLLVHPAFLDVCLQSLFAGVCAPGDGTLWTTYLPTTIRKVRINPAFLESIHDESAAVDSYVTNASSQSVVGDVDVFDERDNMQIQIEGLACNSFSKATAANDRKLFSKLVWKSDISNGSDAQSGDACKSSIEDFAVEVSERAAYYYLRNLRHKVQPKEDAALKWHFQKLVNFADHVLPVIANGGYKSVRPEWMSDTRELIDSLVRRHPDQIDVQMVHAVGSNLVDIVQERREALEVMRENNMLDRLYTEGIGFPRANEHVCTLTSQIAHRYPHMRVLEIGAGTGGTTRSVLKGVGHNFSSYFYTDISAGFFENAQGLFKEHVSKMKFMTLDIEKDVLRQGFSDYSFDLIVASNVLHATRVLEKTMKNVRRLLKPGGYLICMEVTGQFLRNQLIMSGLPGWWLGVEDGRPYTPTITEVQWDALLGRTGFSGIDTVEQDHTDSSQHSLSVMVSQAVDDRVNAFRQPLSFPDLVPATERFVMVGGKTLRSAKIIREVKRVLRPWNRNVEAVDCLEDLEVESQGFASMSVLCLTDLDEPYFEHLTPVKLRALQKVFEKAKHVLWSTWNCRSENPYANMIVGFARSLQWELSHLSLQLVDLEITEGELTISATAQYLANTMLRLVMAESAELMKGLLWSVEPEILIQGDKVMIPRIVANDKLNDRLNSARRSIMEDLDLASSSIELSQDTGLWLTRHLEPESPWSDRGDMVEICVKYSLMHAIRVAADSYLFLCLGDLTKTGRRVVALSKSNTSSVIVPVTWTTECVVSDEQALQYLWSFACALIGRDILQASPVSGTAIVHEPDSYLQVILTQQALRETMKVRFIRKSRQSGFDDNTIIVHPAASSRDIRRIIPKDIKAIFDMKSSEDSISSITRCVPNLFLHTMPWFFSPKSILCPKFPQKVLETVLPGIVKLLASMQFGSLPALRNKVIDISSFANESIAKVSPDVMIAWRPKDVVPVRIDAIDASTLFSKEKTYLLAGLTGELGQSLAHWMVLNGARYIVLTSRRPQIPGQWLKAMQDLDAVIKVAPLDLSNRTALYALYDDIQENLPPIGGVANGAMVLSDKSFLEMGIDHIEKVFLPKVTGTQLLDELFCEKSLGFFILFSSLAAVVGNRGQSNYNAANMFMVSMVRQRRKRGLVASAMDIGMIIGLGYVARTGTTYERPLREMNFMPISEREFHRMFTEAIVAGQSKSEDDSEMIIGLEEALDSVETGSQPPWINNPRFSHLVQTGSVAVERQGFTNIIVPVKEQLRGAVSVEDAVTILQRAFLARLELMLQLSSESINVATSLVALGVDSLVAVDIRTWFLKELKTDLPIFKILGGATVAEFCFETICNLPIETLPEFAEDKPEDKRDAKTTHVETIVHISSPPSSDKDSTAYGSWTPPQNATTPASVITPAPSVRSKSPVLGLHTSDSELEPWLGHGLLKTDGHTQASLIKKTRLSMGQSSQWFLWNYLNDPSTYNVAVQYTLRGPLDRRRLGDALKAVVLRHDALRTRYFRDMESKETLQGVQKESLFELEYKMLTSDDQAQLEFNRLRSIHFALDKGHCLEALLINRMPNVHQLIVSYHHIAMDGISWRIFLGDVHKAYMYQALSPLVYQFTDYAEHERTMIGDGLLEAGLAYWKNEFKDLPEPLPLLPISKVPCRHALEVYETKTVSLELDIDVVLRVKQASKRLQTTPFQFYLSVLQVFLFRHTKAHDFCVGIVDANRSDQRFLETIGYFINTLAVRFNLDGSNSFNSLVAKTRDKVYASMANAKLPFDVLLEELKVPRSPTYPPLFQVLMNYRLGALEQSTLGHCELIGDKGSVAMTPYDLTLLVLETSKGTSLLQFDVQQYLYSTDDAKQLLKSYAHLIDVFSRQPLLQVGECELYSRSAVEQSPEFGRGLHWKLDYPATLMHRIDDQVQERPRSLAIKDCYGFELSYQAMASKSAAIASTILSKVRTQSVVALLCEPSADAICSVLAILRTGSICVPLDLSNPLVRLQAILDECHPHAILYHKQTAKIAAEFKLSKCCVIDLSEISVTASCTVANNSKPNMPAFILYTSGTTGLPKGITLSHLSLVNVIAGATKSLGLGEETVLQQSSLGFDLSISQIFFALANGGKLIVANRDQRGDAVELSELILREGITLTFCVPSEYSILLRYSLTNLKRCTNWRIAMSGGEKLTSRIKQQFCELDTQVSLINVYGPAETTLLSHLGKVTYEGKHADRGETYEAVGKALPNYSTYILDQKHEPVPVGIPGEIYIGGPGVSPGYTNNDELNARNFLVNPFASAEELELGWNHMYKTGDKGRLLCDGSLVPLGRIDGDKQIKLRGMRIELEGVENTILTAANGIIAEAVVITRGEPLFLVGFVTFAADETPSDVDGYLKKLLQRLPLPNYMRPSILAPLERIPHTANGKADRVAMEKIVISRKSETHCDGIVLSPDETKMSNLWRELIYEDESTPLKIDRDTDFFEVGGNSLLVVELQDAVRKAFGAPVPLRDFFLASSLQNMVARVSSRLTEEERTTEIDWTKETAVPPEFHEITRATSATFPATSKRILLTGAFGFLGTALLQVLVDSPSVAEVHCVAIRQQPRAALRASSVQSTKIILHAGNLSYPNLGLSDADFSFLSSTIDAIIHNGAEVSFLKTYPSLRKVNVESTKTLLALALPRRIPIHYVSTGGIARLLGTDIPLEEAPIPADVTPISDGSDGYVASKWASERFLQNASTELVLPVCIHRPTYIIGEGAPATDLVSTILQYSAKMRTVPELQDWHGCFDLIHVNSVAHEITREVLGDYGEKSGYHVRHQCGESRIAVGKLQEYMEKLVGTRCGKMELGEWILAAGREGLTPMILLYLNMLVGQEVWLPEVKKGKKGKKGSR